jgi:Zn-dependent protease with chaperone function
MPMLSLDETVALALSWMLTYLIHSTILVLSVWLICRGIKPLAKRIGPSGENLGWKLALVGAFVSSTVQLAAGVNPALGALELQAGPKVVERAPAIESRPQQVLRARPVIVDADETEVVMLGVEPALAAAPEVSEVETEAAPVWPKLLVGAWLLGAIIALARLGGSVVSLRRKLADRREVIEDPVLEGFLTLCRDVDIRRKIRLTATANISSPIALWRSEIVIPLRAVEELSPAAMRSVLAHELAHLERRDPHWLALGAIIEAVCFFQPLNRLARRGMQESAELLCDDWAIGRTGDGVQFAKSLAELASWNAAAPTSVLVAGMLGERPLVRRVERALDGDPRRFATEDSPRPVRVLLGLGTLAALIMIAPGAVDASPPKSVETGDVPSPKSRKKSEAKAERDAAKAAERAREARARADQALREAEQAEAEARDAARAAGNGHDQPTGRQHMIIRDGDDHVIVDENGVRMHIDGADVIIIDGENPRMQIRMHEDGVNLDLDVDLETLEGLADMLLGGGGFLPPGVAPHAPMPPHPPMHPHAPAPAPAPAPPAFGVPGFDADAMDEWAEEMEDWAKQFEGQFGEEFGEEFEHMGEELEQMLEQQLRGGFPQGIPGMPGMPAPTAPSMPAVPPLPGTPAPAPGALIPA